MASYREHHFVPKFYLRNFSSDERPVGKRRFVSVHNLASDRFFHGSSIKGECRRARLYGENPRVENALSDLEGTWATVIREILLRGTPPERMSDHHLVLLAFVSMQHGRTPVALSIHDEMMDAFGKLLVKAGIERGQLEKVKLDDFKISVGGGMQFMLEVSARMSMLLSDMQMLLITTPSGTSFLTGDHPVAFFNEMARGLNLGGVGAQSPGLLISIPLSPDKLLLLFDHSCYGLGRRNPQAVIGTTEDVASLNRLQLSEADENVYFDPRTLSENDVRALAKGVSRSTNRTKHLQRTAVYPDGSTEQVEASGGIVPDVSVSMSFLKTLEYAEEMRRAMCTAIPIRHPELAAEFEHFKEVVSRREPTLDFGQYLMRVEPLWTSLRNGRRGYAGPRLRQRIERIKAEHGGRLLTFRDESSDR